MRKREKKEKKTIKNEMMENDSVSLNCSSSSTNTSDSSSSEQVDRVLFYPTTTSILQLEDIEIKNEPIKRDNEEGFVLVSKNVLNFYIKVDYF